MFARGGLGTLPFIIAEGSQNTQGCDVGQAW